MNMQEKYAHNERLSLHLLSRIVPINFIIASAYMTPLIIVNIVGLTTSEKPTLKTLRIKLWVHTIYHKMSEKQMMMYPPNFTHFSQRSNLSCGVSHALSNIIKIAFKFLAI